MWLNIFLLFKKSVKNNAGKIENSYNNFYEYGYLDEKYDYYDNKYKKIIDNHDEIQ